MKFKNAIMFIAGAGVALAAASCATQGGADCLQYVDVKIGSGGHGHVFVGASVPFGLVQVGPTSIPITWDWCSGYHESDSTVIGFSHTHLSGTGKSDLFDVTVMPVTGEVKYARGDEGDPASGLWSYADRSKEVARAGYYSVPLTRYGITAEMTATERVGLSRYTFPASDEAAVVFDLENGDGDKERTTDSHIDVVDGSTISGWRFSAGWARAQKVYFYAVFSKPFDSFEQVSDLYGRANFKTSEGEQILLKVALSPTGVEAAKANLEAELPGWDVEATAEAADARWNEELSKIRVSTGDATALKVFYTALYHTMISPALFCDADGAYMGADWEVHPDPGYRSYTIYSLWDTYRAEMPLLTLFQQARYSEMVNNMVAICEEQGHLPVWHLWGNETYCMVGNPGVPAVADAIVKDIPGFDRERAYAAVRKTELDPTRINGMKNVPLDKAVDYDKSIGLRNKYGYIPSDLMQKSAAYDMEYAIADGAAARAAEALGRTEDAEYFTQRSRSYRNYFDAETGFIKGRDSKGGWRKDYNPYFSRSEWTDFCEGNGWQYTWLAPHDVQGLRDCFGSTERMIGKLDSLFTADMELPEDLVASDVTGLIGQYAHGNEPSHSTIYLYSMLGYPWKAADRIRQVLSTLYTAEPDGLSGNEDAGQMSAWYVLSSIGLYEAEPASGRYWFGAPIFDRVEIDVPGGTFTLVTDDNSDSNRYIQEAWLDGEPYTKPWISYADIVRGSTLRLAMGPEPALWCEAE